MKSSFSRAVVVGALVLTVVSLDREGRAAGPSASSPVQDEAKKHFNAGIQAMQSAQWEKARAELLLAWQSEANYRIAANLGRVELELGRHRDAAEHLTYCLRNATAMSAAHKAAVQALFDEARAKVGELRVKLSEPGAEVLVDGGVVGKTPIAGVFVEPGRRTITARKAGKTFEEKPVDIGAGQTAEVVILERRTTPASMSKSTAPRRSDEQASRWKWWAVPTAAGVAAVGLGVGFGLRVRANGLSDDAEARGTELAGRTPLDQKVCGPESPPANQGGCAEILSTLKKKDSAADISTAGFIVGGVGAASAIVMALWPARAREAVQVVPVVQRSESGLRIVGSF